MSLLDSVWRLIETLAAPFFGPEGRTFLPFLVVAALIAVAVEARRHPGPWRQVVVRGLGVGSWGHRSTLLDVQILAVRQMLRLVGVLRLGSAAALAIGLARGLDAWVGRPDLPSLHPALIAVGYTLALFVVGDLSRFLLHRAAHRIPFLWEFHKVHHSAEVLTPLSFHRIHPVESLLYHLRGVLVTGTLGGLAWWAWREQAVVVTVLGVEAVGFVLNGVFGNLRHSHVWLSFGPRVERWFLSPAQHQLHHSVHPAEHESNYGVWLAIWDRLGGSHRLAGPVPPVAFGLGPGELNHGPSLRSALGAPFPAAWARVVASWRRMIRRHRLTPG